MSHTFRSSLILAVLALSTLPVVGCEDESSGSSPGVDLDAGSDAAGTGGGGAGGGAAGSGGGATGGGGLGGQGGSAKGGAGGIPIGDCVKAEGTAPSATDTWDDAPDQAKVVIEDPTTCSRTYVLSTTAKLRDDQPGNPRTYSEAPGQPVVRTGHDMLDALHALAIEESREASVSAISNGGFNGGAPLDCPPGGCFETGRLWTYVWTRDTSYSVALGLGLLDPTRARNSMEFKVSTRRDGTNPEIVQDTGSGGSYPISSDRAVWAMGAWELLKVLDGAERIAFRDLAYEAIVNTAARDRLVVWDSEDGLYRGEQSFLDWRDQSYPAWTANDTVHVGMSKALGTNIAHLVLLDVASKLAAERGEADASLKYAGWAKELGDAIRDRLWLPDRQLFSSFTTTWLDPAPVQRFDLLGSALAVLSDVATPAQAAEVVSRYPHLPKGAPVIWPQQQATAIYHNRAIWPFATAFWAKAAARTGNPEAVELAVRSLVRGAALNLSNMENFEAVTGANWLEEGATSGPVVNSQRQLWSIAGFVSVVHEVIFGLEMTQQGIRFAPRITRGLRRTFFSGMDSIALSRLKYRGKRVSVKVTLPAAGAGNGMLDVVSVRLNGQDAGSGFVDAQKLADDNLFEVELGPGVASNKKVEVVDDTETADYRNLFGPRTPALTAVGLTGDRIEIAWTSGENAEDVTFNVYRDGVRIAEGLPGDSQAFVDAGSANHATDTYCYTVEAVFKSSGNASQHDKPQCYWGPGYSRIQHFGAQQFEAQGGTLVSEFGRWHYADWGNASDTLTVKNVTPVQTGRHLLQVVAGNGAGDFTTGITCGVKAIEVWDGASLVGGGQLMMPHLATWNDWRESSFVPVELVAGKAYTIVIREDGASGNMSDFSHFATYGATGGIAGRFNKVNIAEVKVMAVTGP